MLYPIERPPALPWNAFLVKKPLDVLFKNVQFFTTTVGELKMFRAP